MQELIAGVRLREVKNVCGGRGGHLTELYRSDWGLDDSSVDQVFQVVFEAGGISGWHAHRFTTDRLFVSYGQARIVLYDGRAGSPTHGRLNGFLCGLVRPGLVVVPPGIWHAVQNIHHGPSIVTNIVDRAYEYDDPDHWRLPIGSDKIPYRFAGIADGADL